MSEVLQNVFKQRAKTVIRGRLQGGDLTPVSCAQFQDHLRFINVTSGREAYARVFVRTFVFSESHLRTFAK